MLFATKYATDFMHLLSQLWMLFMGVVVKFYCAVVVCRKHGAAFLA
jgi:hypothetical protein